MSSIWYGYNIQLLDTLFASICAGYIDAASTAETHLLKPGRKHSTSPPMLVTLCSRVSPDTIFVIV